MKTLLSIAALAVILSLACCKKDEVTPQKPTESERVTEILTSGTGKWNPSTNAGVLVDGMDVTSDLFAGFSITFSGDKLFTTGTTPVWLREDTWHFKDESGKVIIRGQDNKEVTIVSVTDNQLQLSLDWDQTTYEEGGRAKSIPGTFVFTLSK